MLGELGCGKSLSAKAVAAYWRLPLLRLDLAAVFGGGVPPEAALKRALRAAEAVAPCALWIDEIEKGLAGSDSSREGSPEGARVLGSFATWLQEKKSPVLVVATANEVTSLPPELLRKDMDLGLGLGREWDVPMPVTAATREVLQSLASTSPHPRVAEAAAAALK